jgi:hypothetical protein
MTQLLILDQLPRKQSRYQLVVQRLRDAIAHHDHPPPFRPHRLKDPLRHDVWPATSSSASGR